MARSLLLIPTASYRAQDFLEAARRLGIEVGVGGDRRQVLEAAVPGRTLTLDFAEPRAAGLARSRAGSGLAYNPSMSRSTPAAT